MSPRRPRHSLLQAGKLLPLLILSGIWVVLLSCHNTETTGPAPLSATQGYWALQLSEQAVNMSLTPPYNTLQLTAQPVNAAGDTLAIPKVVSFQSNDSSVTVSPTGLLTAHFTTALSQVVVTLTAQGIAATDTVVVQVTQDTMPSRLAILSIHPAAGDSAKRTVDTQGYILPVYDTMANGQPVPSGSPLLVALTSSDPTVATIDRTTGALTLFRVGHMTLSASTWPTACRSAIRCCSWSATA